MAKKIMLDPGHGGNDTGACANGIVERDLNLQVALQAQTLLRAAGHDVKLTRQSNGDGLSLYDRARASVDFGADVFVSVHHDADGGEGCVAFYNDPSAVNGKDLATKLATGMSAEFGLHYSWGDPACLWTYNGNPSHLGVLNNADNWIHADAALIECNMLTNASDAALDKRPDYVSRAGWVVASAIQAHVGGSAIVRPGSPLPPSGEDTPDASKPSSWATGAAEWMKAHELSDCTRPREGCTREEVWCYMERIGQLLGVE
jgi:N-acetylmuramoyl-L-alanine amidase